MYANWPATTDPEERKKRLQLVKVETNRYRKRHEQILTGAEEKGGDDSQNAVLFSIGGGVVVFGGKIAVVMYSGGATAALFAAHACRRSSAAGLAEPWAEPQCTLRPAIRRPWEVTGGPDALPYA